MYRVAAKVDDNVPKDIPVAWVNALSTDVVTEINDCEAVFGADQGNPSALPSSVVAVVVDRDLLPAMCDPRNVRSLVVRRFLETHPIYTIDTSKPILPTPTTQPTTCPNSSVGRAFNY